MAALTTQQVAKVLKAAGFRQSIETRSGRIRGLAVCTEGFSAKYEGDTEYAGGQLVKYDPKGPWRRTKQTRKFVRTGAVIVESNRRTMGNGSTRPSLDDLLKALKDAGFKTIPIGQCDSFPTTKDGSVPFGIIVLPVK